MVGARIKQGMAALAVSCVLALCAFAPSAHAQDLLVGVFTGGTSAGSNTNHIYVSEDGTNMYRVGTVFDVISEDSARYGSTEVHHYAQVCPSIMYHDGYFWSISGDQWAQDGKARFYISVSKDLVTWTHPESGFPGNDVALSSYPTVDGKERHDFDVVAPEWSKDKDGNIYIVFSAGYYGAYHGDATNDQMQAYTIKVNSLSVAGMGNIASDSPHAVGGKYAWPRDLQMSAEPAKKLSFSNYEGADFIDGQLFADGGTNYLIIKKDGVHNQVYRNANANDANGWQLVADNITYSYEAPCVVKFNGQYLLFGDEVVGDTAVGTDLFTAGSMTQTPWNGPREINFTDIDNGGSLIARHGTVIVVKDGTEEWKAANALLNGEGGKFTRLAGDNALGTMQKIVGTGFADGSCTTAVVATDGTYHDALSAAGIAGLYDCPVLLTSADNREDISAETKAELKRLGVEKVYVVGGSYWIKDAAIKVLEDLGYAVERLAGGNAAETALKVFEAGKTAGVAQDTVEPAKADRAAPEPGSSMPSSEASSAAPAQGADDPAADVASAWGKTAIVATDQTYHDALAAGPYAFAKGLPIFLTSDKGANQSTKLSANTLKAIQDGGFDRVILCGGTWFLDASVEQQLGSVGFVGGMARRIMGDTAVETSQQMAEFCLSEGMQANGIGIATSEIELDALTGAAFCGKNNAPLILVNADIYGSSPNLSSINGFVGANKAAIEQGYLFGGSYFLPAKVMRTANVVAG